MLSESNIIFFSHSKNAQKFPKVSQADVWGRYRNQGVTKK